MNLEINNLTGYKLDKKSFTQVAKKILSGENRGMETVSLVFIGKSEMQKLNKKHRGKDEATDVLSFELNDRECLGEIVICPEAVREGEMLKVFSHGILHLLGYDHEKSKKEAEIMEAKEKFYLNKI